MLLADPASNLLLATNIQTSFEATLSYNLAQAGIYLPQSMLVQGVVAAVGGQWVELRVSELLGRIWKVLVFRDTTGVVDFR